MQWFREGVEVEMILVIPPLETCFDLILFGFIYLEKRRQKNI